MTIDDLVKAVQFRCEQRLSHLGCKIIMQKMDCDTGLGVGILMPDGSRHGAMAEWVLDADPIELADRLSDMLLKRHAEKQP